MSNYEEVCANAALVVEKYIFTDNDKAAADMFDELKEAQNAVDVVWDTVTSRKARRVCRAVYHACLAARSDERFTARVYVDEYWTNTL